MPKISDFKNIKLTGTKTIRKFFKKGSFLYFSNAKLQNILTIRGYWLIDKFNHPIILLRIKKSSLIVLPVKR